MRVHWCLFSRVNSHTPGPMLAPMSKEVGHLLGALSDDALVASLRAICMEGNRVLARLLVHLGEIEERGLHLKAACSSMFDYCVRRLGMSEGEAFRRIAAARLTRRFPSLLPRIERGEIHLSALVL